MLTMIRDQLKALKASVGKLTSMMEKIIPTIVGRGTYPEQQSSQAYLPAPPRDIAQSYQPTLSQQQYHRAYEGKNVQTHY